MESIKTGQVRGYNEFWVVIDNPMDKPKLQDFEGNDIDYLTELQIWERAENNRKRIPIIKVHQKLARKFLDKTIKFELIAIENRLYAKILGLKK